MGENVLTNRNLLAFYILFRHDRDLGKNEKYKNRLKV